MNGGDFQQNGLYYDSDEYLSSGNANQIKLKRLD